MFKMFARALLVVASASFIPHSEAAQVVSHSLRSPTSPTEVIIPTGVTPQVAGVPECEAGVSCTRDTCCSSFWSAESQSCEVSCN